MGQETLFLGGRQKSWWDRKVFWAEQIGSNFVRVGKVGEAGERLKLKKMGDGGRRVGVAENLILAGKVGGLTRLVWQKMLVSQFLE